MEEYLDISGRNGILGYNGVMMCLVFWDKKLLTACIENFLQEIFYIHNSIYQTKSGL